MRERGLKSVFPTMILWGWWSLPVRERGLKCKTKRDIRYCQKSLPVRERGLKSPWLVHWFQGFRVAPCAGAWVEMRIFVHLLHRVGSLPVRERGLKYPSVVQGGPAVGRSLCGSVG